MKEPVAVEKYNEFVGGVNLIDYLLSPYRISMRIKKSMLHVFAQFLDMACCNGWIEYKTFCEQFDAKAEKARPPEVQDGHCCLIKAETRHHKAESDDEAEDTKCNKEVQNHFSASR